MSEIKTFEFNQSGFAALKKYQYGTNWPVVYILENGQEAYVGETINAASRSGQHYDNADRKKLEFIHIITDSTYNKSATLDIESSLMQYMAADGLRVLQNANGGLKNHSYYDREIYQAKIKGIWEKLKKLQLAKKSIDEIKNSDLFKYSPYKALTEDQSAFVKKIFADIKKDKAKTYVVSGQPGTGKTVLATYLVKYLKEHKDTKHLKIALVIPMGALRTTIKKVFRNIKGLSADMVVIANDVAREDYDLVIVDEAHRLKRRRNLGAAFGAFDNVNSALGLGSEATQLEWVIKKSKRQIFFYDENQSVTRADIRAEEFKSLKNAVRYDLTTQLRVRAGEKYIKFVENLLHLKNKGNDFGRHDFKIYDNACEMVEEIKSKDKEMGLCRMVAGYAWPWNTNPNRKNKEFDYDIKIGACKLKWNSVATDWVNSPNAINEVGCIHTTQGYDLNYVGVIIGPELKYDKNKKEMYIDRDEYYDRNGIAGVTDDSELKRYILNIYKTLLTRGIKGTYVYIADDNLREYFKSFLTGEQLEKKKKSISEKKTILDKIIETVQIPLVGCAPCGEAVFGEENIEEQIEVDKNKIKPGYEYFIVRADGDSMNLAGIQDGELVLCRAHGKADTGDRIVALLGDDVTIKYYDKKDGRRILLPKSTNPKHQPIIPEEGSMTLGIVQEVLE